ncbi:glycosyltransferase [Corynebacterium sp. UBA2622]|uniref:glycosyltransferase n=1 Tax=Corynebacterium sp. UBA2622 TaxID=1946393 RepID=UPI0025B8DD68|nr:glycosyltransferase [Corynebacterium sp. UBA2622]
MWPDVSVIIPHYNNPSALADVVAAVRAQDYPGAVEIIVADDGSDTVPAVPGATVVTQEDRGFRAAAARNLGAAAAKGEVLAFFDGDTVPEPGYLSAVVPHIQRNRRAVVVGSRLTGPERAEPEWLAQAWRTTDHLRRADSASWRFIISAALTCSANFFRHIGGFDATLVGYGGEDWEFGFRAWNSGAELVHEPAAVAVHPASDFGSRHSDAREEARVKNGESVALARRITHPLARPSGVVFDTPDVSVAVPELDEPGALEAVVASWLRIDARVHVTRVPELFATDPRVVDTAPSGAPNARIRVTLARAWALDDADAFYRRATDRHLRLGDGTAIVSARARALTSPSVRSRGELAGLRLLEGPQRLERVFAGW